MPPRFAYWTIIAGGLPTAFRAAERDELLPTFKRLQTKHPDAELKYFAQGRLWSSQDEARQAREVARAPRPGSRGEIRGKDWRPGGEHRDPRQKFIDQKKERNQRWRQERFDKKFSGPDRRGPAGPRGDRRPPIDKPHGDPLRKEVPPSFERRPRDNRPPRPEWRDKPAGKDWRSERPDFKRPAPRSSGHRPPASRQPGNRAGSGQNRSWRDRPYGETREEKPPRAPRPDREPRRGDEDPNRPPRPSEPRTDPPGPPERGRSRPPRPAGHKGPRRPFKKNSR